MRSNDLFQISTILNREVNRDFVILCHNKENLEIIQENLLFFTKKHRILTFPSWDCLPFDDLTPSSRIVTQRLKTLREASDQKRRRIACVTNYYALSQKVVGNEWIKNFYCHLHIKKDRQSVLAFLDSSGYVHCHDVHSPGEYSVRGSILDIGIEDQMLRCDFGFEGLETLTLHNMYSSNQKQSIQEITLYSASEKRQLPDKNSSPTYKTASLIDYLDNPKILTPEKATFEKDKILKKIAAASDTEQADYLSPNTLSSLVDAGLMRFNAEKIDTYPVENYHFTASTIRNATSFSLIKESLKKSTLSGPTLSNKTLFICTASKGSLYRTSKALENHEMPYSIVEHPQKSNQICLAIAPLERGFATDHFYFLSEHEVFGSSSAAKKRHSSQPDLSTLEGFYENELVVHSEYGIGKLLGLTNIEMSGQTHDFITILYHDNDKLLVPVEDIRHITKYRHGEMSLESSHAPLDKLGGQRWKYKRAKIKEKITQISHRIIATNAARKKLKTEPILFNKREYEQFREQFPYVETEDQLSAIQSVQSDLSSQTPMDRLVCGDAGFGKTEVAIRATFFTLNDTSCRYQVAVISPSTLLCEQHFKTFKERFPEHSVAKLSRFTRQKDKKNILKALENGSIDILIGTHALFAKSLQFLNLKLLIIDEEHIFGVKQKEILKQRYPSIHILSLSATPIPRTLYLSLSGMKDLSLISSPPMGKAKTEVFIIPYCEKIIFEAIRTEIAREGQVFYVCPRIKELDKVFNRLQTNLPEVRLKKAHGQMPTAVVESIILELEERKFNVLVSTTIIEAGLNLPNVNTIIIDDAYRFGMSQLYQLCGRVGRAHRKAYAYLALPPHIIERSATVGRLRILKQMNSQNAGFYIATHDMESRGFGNLLGTAQSGHIKEIGIELYQQMLEESLRTPSKSLPTFNPKVDLGMPVSIPKSYIQDHEARLLLYRQIASKNSLEAIDSLSVDIVNQFGEIPQETSNLLRVMQFKILAQAAFISEILVQKTETLCTIYPHEHPNPEALLNLVVAQQPHISLTAQQKIAIYHRNLPESIFLFLEKFLKSIQDVLQ